MDNLNIIIIQLSNFISLILVFFIIYQIYQYKKVLSVIKRFNELKNNKALAEEDKTYIKTQYKEYEALKNQNDKIIKLLNPLAIIIASLLLLLFNFQEALIHFNIIIVALVYFYLKRIHFRNIVSFLDELSHK